MAENQVNDALRAELDAYKSKLEDAYNEYNQLLKVVLPLGYVLIPAWEAIEPMIGNFQQNPLDATEPTVEGVAPQKGRNMMAIMSALGAFFNKQTLYFVKQNVGKEGIDLLKNLIAENFGTESIPQNGLEEAEMPNNIEDVTNDLLASGLSLEDILSMSKDEIIKMMTNGG